MQYYFFYLLFPLHSLVLPFASEFSLVVFVLARLFSVMPNCARHFISNRGSFTLSASSRCLTPREPSFTLQITNRAYCVNLIRAVRYVLCSYRSVCFWLNMCTFVCVLCNTLQHLELAGLCRCFIMMLPTKTCC